MFLLLRTTNSDCTEYVRVIKFLWSADNIIVLIARLLLVRSISRMDMKDCRDQIAQFKCHNNESGNSPSENIFPRPMRQVAGINGFDSSRPLVFFV
jgi:hypothetical protein